MCGIELMGGWPLAFYIPGTTGNAVCPRSLVHFYVLPTRSLEIQFSCSQYTNGQDF